TVSAAFLPDWNILTAPPGKHAGTDPLGFRSRPRSFARPWWRFVVQVEEIGEAVVGYVARGDRVGGAEVRQEIWRGAPPDRVGERAATGDCGDRPRGGTGLRQEGGRGGCARRLATRRRVRGRVSGRCRCRMWSRGR